jgi:hypothetical protein
MGSGASVQVEIYLDNDTVSMSDESISDNESIASMETADISDESSDESLFI